MRASILRRLGLAAALTVSVSCAPAVPDSLAADGLRSVYTSIAPEACTTVKVDLESAGSEQECPGVGGYELRVLDSDARMSVTVRAPDGAEHPLNLWSTITSAFSSLGDRVEWRVRGAEGRVVPVALVVEVLANEEPERPEAQTLYRAVARVGPDGSCVTDRLGSDVSHAEVLRAADAAPDRPCIDPRRR